MGLLHWVQQTFSLGIKKHWKQRKGICKGSPGRVVNLHGRRGTCPVFQASNLAITSEGLSWVHQNQGARRVPTQIRRRKSDAIT